ncbi:MAG: hypothetical protein ABII26_13120 [Pseudomonadota bacterium]
MGKEKDNIKGTRMGDRVPRHLCLHVVNGRTGIPKTCIRKYECWHCAFDQWLDVLLDQSQSLAEAA